MGPSTPSFLKVLCLEKEISDDSQKIDSENVLKELLVKFEELDKEFSNNVETQKRTN